MPSLSKRLLLVGHHHDALKFLERKLAGIPDIGIELKTLDSDRFAPLFSKELSPDILLLRLGVEAHAELAALAAVPPDVRPPAIVIGDTQDGEVMRLAMRAGARDFLSDGVPEAELAAAVHAILSEAKTRRSGETATISAFINAKGGSGSTFVASNVAHLLSVEGGHSVCLIDLDLQFPSAGLALDLKSEHNLLQVLENAHSLDAGALAGYAVRHASGLALLSPPPEQILLPGEVQPEQVRELLSQAANFYDHLVIDLPRQIDSINAGVMEVADTTVIVLQQTVAHIRDAKRMLRIMRSDLDVPPERIRILVNRYNKKNRLDLTDIRRTLEVDHIDTLANDFENADSATNLGHPMYEHARRSPLTGDLLSFARVLAPKQTEAKANGLLGRLIGRRRAN